MLPVPNAAPLISVNGVRFFTDHNRTSYLYYSSSTTSKFCRVRLDNKNVVEGTPELLPSLAFPPDDFALAKDGTAYITSDVGSAFMKRESDGTVTVIGGDRTNGTVFARATSVRLGRVRERDTVYVTTFAGNLLAIEV